MVVEEGEKHDERTHWDPGQKKQREEKGRGTHDVVTEYQFVAVIQTFSEQEVTSLSLRTVIQNGDGVSVCRCDPEL